MKTIHTMALSILSVIGIMSAKADEKSGSLEVKISGIRSNQGKIMAAVGDYTAAPGKMAGEMIQSDTTGVTIFFRSLPLGTHNLYVFHDENSNFTLDMGETGVPQEGFGAENQVQFQTKVVITSEPQTKSLKMFYLK